jgi:CDI immunity proteins
MERAAPALREVEHVTKGRRARSTSASQRQRGFDISRTLQDLEDKDRDEPPFPSYLVTTCHRLRRKPIREFSVEDLRIMIGQEIGLEYLVPVALERLAEDPFIHGDFFPGDLLRNVVSLPAGFWDAHPELRREAVAVAVYAAEVLRALCLAKRRALGWS